MMPENAAKHRQFYSGHWKSNPAFAFAGSLALR